MSGVCVAGFTTAMQPAVMAGAILRVAMASGEPAQELATVRNLAAAEHTGKVWTEFEGSTLSVLTRSYREASEIVRGVLGTLSEKTPKTDVLRETLSVYLRNDRRWDATASELRIHRQTLSYHLRRIGEEDAHTH